MAGAVVRRGGGRPLRRSGWVQLLVVGLSAWLVGCAAEKPVPAPLQDYAPKLKVASDWSRSIGAPPAYLSMVRAGHQLAVANRDEVLLLEATTGAEQARLPVNGRIETGVGFDGRHMAVVTEASDLVVLDASREVWRLRLASPVATAPLVAGGRVFVLTVDRRVEAYDLLDGQRLWVHRRPGEPLNLSQPGVLMAYKDTLLVGVGARLVGLDPLQGSVRSDLAVAASRGVNEVERLSDLVGPAARVGDTICLRSFQVAVACVNADRASLLWSRQQSGYQGLAADADVVVAADSSDRVTAWKRSSGDLLWSTERLRNRGLSAPVSFAGAVVFGDGEGWLHFLDRSRGETLLRLPTDGSAVAAPLLRDAHRLWVLTRDGRLQAFRPE